MFRGRELFEEPLAAAADLELAQSPGGVVHNPFLLEALLIGSIDEVESTYGVPLLSDSSLARRLGVR